MHGCLFCKNVYTRMIWIICYYFKCVSNHLSSIYLFKDFYNFIVFSLIDFNQFEPSMKNVQFDIKIIYTLQVRHSNLDSFIFLFQTFIQTVIQVKTLHMMMNAFILISSSSLLPPNILFCLMMFEKADQNMQFPLAWNTMKESDLICIDSV